MYLLDFGFTTDSLISIYVTGHCLYLCAWTTSLDHVHVWLPEANWFYLTYSLGYFLTTLNLHVQILESGLWWSYCSWSECAVEARISGSLSGASFLPAPFDPLARFSSCYSWVFFSLFILYFMFCASWWSNIHIISCSVITVYLCYYCWNVYYHCASVLWFLHVLMLSVYMWGYFRPAYIRRSNVSVPARSGRYNLPL